MFNEIIYTYTQAQAIDDGILFPVERAVTAELGLRIPVIMTVGCHAACSDGDRVDQERRLVVLKAMRRALIGAAGERRATFTVALDRGIDMMAVLGGDDDGRPCITVGPPSDF